MHFDGEMAKRVMTTNKNIIAKAQWIEVKCKFCGSVNIYHFGFTKKGTQRYLCNDCRRIFTDNKASIGMRYPTEAIASALNQFYESASLHKIKRQLHLTYGVRPDHSTIYRWIDKYSKKAVKELDSVPIRTAIELQMPTVSALFWELTITKLQSKVVYSDYLVASYSIKGCIDSIGNDYDKQTRRGWKEYKEGSWTSG